MLLKGTVRSSFVYVIMFDALTGLRMGKSCGALGRVCGRMLQHCMNTFLQINIINNLLALINYSFINASKFTITAQSFFTVQYGPLRTKNAKFVTIMT